ncbi:hypothetical protein BZM27_53340, partial [Paraburkholderia steynii]
PDAVLDDYRKMERAFRYDLEWAEPLLNVVELRGRMPAEKHRWVASVMRAAKLPISAQNVDAIVAAVDALPAACDFISVDDRFRGRYPVRGIIAADVQRAADVGHTP